MSALERLINILKRELDALDVHVKTEETLADQAEITWPLGPNRWLALTFPSPPTDLQPKRERLAILAESFADLIAEASRETPRPRPEPIATLQSELNALAGRTHATCALVIDAKSPIIWGASEAPTNSDDAPIDAQIHQAFTHLHALGISWRKALAQPHAPQGERKPSTKSASPKRGLRLVPPIDEFAGLTPPERAVIAPCAEQTRRAIARLRAHPILPQLHRGEHLHEAIVDPSVAYLARSFASIYILVLVFPGAFDELGAERAIVRALPIIERLVISLPPDNTPEYRQGAVVSLRPRRR